MINEKIKCRRKLVNELKFLDFIEASNILYVYIATHGIIEVRFHYHGKGYNVSLLYYHPSHAHSHIEIYNYAKVINFLNQEFNWFFRKEKIKKLLDAAS